MKYCVLGGGISESVILKRKYNYERRSFIDDCS